VPVDACVERVRIPRGDAEVNAGGTAAAGHAGETNTWLIGDEDEVIVIDPGAAAGAVLEQVGEREILAVICTPGHTPGSVSLYCADLEIVFTGDALSARGPVPHEGEFSDFPGQLNAIGERLLDLPLPTRVLPGHGEESTVADAVKRFDGWVSAGPAGELG
jgi:glyoxylase-like metal-dependent hydrolase (beta-lactamase superfamily II)